MTYAAKARRIGAWWALDVPEVPGVHTQVRRLDQAEAMVRDAIAAVRDIPPDSFDVTIQPHLPQEARALVDQAATARARAAAAQEDAGRLTREAARLLVEQQGLTVRDAGALLAMSHQRIAQLVGRNS